MSILTISSAKFSFYKNISFKALKKIVRIFFAIRFIFFNLATWVLIKLKLLVISKVNNNDITVACDPLFYNTDSVLRFSGRQIKDIKSIHLIPFLNTNKNIVHFDSFERTENELVLKFKEKIFGYYLIQIKRNKVTKNKEQYLSQFLNISSLHFELEQIPFQTIKGESIHLKGALFKIGERVKYVTAEIQNLENNYSFFQPLYYPQQRFDLIESYNTRYEALISGFYTEIKINTTGQFAIRLKYQLFLGPEKVTPWISDFIVHKKTNIKPPFPKFSIVTILHNKAKEVPYFIESVFRQKYQGDIEVVLINDMSNDNSNQIVEDTFKSCKIKYPKSPIINYKIINNEMNLGNCLSRNLGIKNSTGDYIVIIDADCMFNDDYFFQHAEAYYYNDTDVVIGSYNLETEKEDPIAFLSHCDHNLFKVINNSSLQDPINPNSFLNCITRNFSIRRQFLEENQLSDLFDKDFTYSMDKDAGFGWEDIEMGYRLYLKKARIKYIQTCFTAHVTHPPSVSEYEKPIKSLRNFTKLYKKHPELKHIARKWTLETYQNILKWGESLNVLDKMDRKFLDKELGYLTEAPYYIKNKNKLKILTYRWHCPHQYELYKLGHEYHLIEDLGTGFTGNWEYEQRPMPDNAKFIKLQDVNKNNYDLAILHFDENVLDYQNCNGIIGPDWGMNFKFMMEHFKHLPKTAICHGTPQFYGQYNAKVPDDLLMKTIEDSRQNLVNYIADMKVICNSYQAHKEWGFKNSSVIWQGFDPAEFPLTNYSKGILTMGKSMQERPHYRGYILYQQVINELFNGAFAPSGPKVKLPSDLYEKNTNDYAYIKYRNYINDICDYSIYFNPTLRSPMPRSRGEAMMCGLATVSANNHDVEMFIKNGINGFYSNEPEELREYLLYLLKNPEVAKRIGYEARKTSMDVFNHDRYLQSWVYNIKEVMG